MSFDFAQGAQVNVKRTAVRLVPCELHAYAADGKQTATKNPNGYRHDCPTCAATPRKYEELED